jgi:hypothetical protein
VEFRDEPHPAHIGGEAEGLLHPACGLQAVIPPAQIQNFKFIRRGRFIFRIFQVDAADPVSFLLQPFHQMVADEPARAGDQNLCRCHYASPDSMRNSRAFQ